MEKQIYRTPELAALSHQILRMIEDFERTHDQYAKIHPPHVLSGGEAYCSIPIASQLPLDTSTGFPQIDGVGRKPDPSLGEIKVG